MEHEGVVGARHDVQHVELNVLPERFQVLPSVSLRLFGSSNEYGKQGRNIGI